MFRFIKLYIHEEILQLAHIHLEHLMDILSSNLYIHRFPAKPAACTIMAYGFAGIAAEHVFILDFISVGLDPFEKFINSYY